MTDLERRAHDIAIAILPDLIKEDPTIKFWISNGSGEDFNSFDITDLYRISYEEILKELQPWYGDE